ncbi:DEAD/DEAH box helicase [Halalkalibacillus halophilus]|uniref:DEAD/DEAH box helicase n=1 Tax=Halalkalibacillus halophilus TaxID=392827 RepID=UPI000414A123|nr:DEAD/DEAH box helicase [Halalkalibacillus halophilus]
MNDLKEIEKNILDGLKDFQQATVSRVYSLFTTGYHRVLVADEVGLGKTMIARGAIAKLAQDHVASGKKDKFKVVYVCSNQSIASQNIKKLQIEGTNFNHSHSENRLTMQHKVIAQERYLKDRAPANLQLIPLTPSTSFSITNSVGNVAERALIYEVLKSYRLFDGYQDKLNTLLQDQAFKGWKHALKRYQPEIKSLEEQSEGEYLKSLHEQIDKYLDQDEELLNLIIHVCENSDDLIHIDKRHKHAIQLIYKLRKMFADISIDQMNPDLVIMDEFQRFPELVDSNSDSETALIAQKFFGSANETSRLNVLLLSATPYKLYSTVEEMEELGHDEHYKEFFRLFGFLFEEHPDELKRFKDRWETYSDSLRTLKEGHSAIIQIKNEAEESLYKGIARTERNSVKGADKLISEVPTELRIEKADITSYMEMNQKLDNLGIPMEVPTDYVMSAPYLMSFMEKYKLKKELNHKVSEQPSNMNKLKSRNLWIDKDQIANYDKVPYRNAKLKLLDEKLFDNQAELLLWVPPSLPYYELGGPFKEQADFSKVLIFSAWEMVPRAVSTLISYEAERKTVGQLIKGEQQKEKEKKHSYFGDTYPTPRINFSMRDGDTNNMNHLTLLYPSETLADLFDPMVSLNNNQGINEIKAGIRKELVHLLNELDIQPDNSTNREDESWYYLAPVLFDRTKALPYMWFDRSAMSEASRVDSDTSEKEKGAFTQHLNQLRNCFFHPESLNLGRQPSDLVEVLVEMVLGSPAIVSLRMLGEKHKDSIPLALQLARKLIDRMNTPEATAIVELTYGQSEIRKPHWKKLLKYNVDGNIQSMLDEYAHMMIGEAGLHQLSKEQRDRELVDLIKDAFTSQAGRYTVDTYDNFKKRNTDPDATVEQVNIRTNFAVSFSGRKNEESAETRKLNVRKAFNSPLRPFVLTTTSVGQEGLDFHHYARKVWHWNLPSNPVDIEQREGRINRYKSFAIRQNIAGYAPSILFKENIWNEMFDYASNIEKDAATPALVPFWTLPNKNDIKIERIVPYYPYSKEQAKYKRLMKILQLYRLSLGQPKQEELVEYFMNSDVDENFLQSLFLNISPYFKEPSKYLSE